MRRAAQRRRLTALGAALTTGGLLLAAAAPSSALYGEAVIEPIESNLAGKPWVSVTASSGTATADRAIDSDAATAWIASHKRPGQWLTLDLADVVVGAAQVEGQPLTRSLVGGDPCGGGIGVDGAVRRRRAAARGHRHPGLAGEVALDGFDHGLPGQGRGRRCGGQEQAAGHQGGAECGQAAPLSCSSHGTPSSR